MAEDTPHGHDAHTEAKLRSKSPSKTKTEEEIGVLRTRKQSPVPRVYKVAYLSAGISPVHDQVYVRIERRICTALSETHPSLTSNLPRQSNESKII
ncbi:hypothetical protein D3C86_2031130 [compost metagenome]